MQTTPVRFYAGFLLALLNLSCHNSDQDRFADCSPDGPEFSISDITGNWRASEAVFDDDAGGNTKDIVADGGTVQLFVDDSGNFTLLIRETNRKSQDFTGSFSFCNGKFYAIYDYDAENYDEYDAVLVDNQLFYYGLKAYDYDGDGVEEQVTVAFTFGRE